MNSASDVVVAAVGDVLVMRDDPQSMFSASRELLQRADVALCQLETSYSDKGSRGSSGPRGVVPKDAHNLPVLAAAGFDVVSMATNHVLDWGADALLDCIEQMRVHGVAPVGAGANIMEARKPVIIERKNTKVAVLAYCSVAPKGYYAAATSPGVAPMRAITHYEPFEEDQPGTPARIMTFPVQKDLDALVADVRAAKQQADVVALAFHWGIHSQRATVADYQRVVAHSAIDAGADIIFGAGTHVLKGAEVYKGKVIFHSIGTFGMENFERVSKYINEEFMREFCEVYDVDDPHNADGATYSMIALCTISGKQISRVSFVPAVIDKGGEPIPVAPSSDLGRAVVAYMTAITSERGMNAKFTIDGNDVLVSA